MPDMDPSDWQQLQRRIEHLEARLQEETKRYDKLNERFAALTLERERMREELEKLHADLGMANVKLTSIALILRP